MSVMPPEFIPADGRIWAVRRAWPGEGDRIAVEAVTARGQVRAGWADRAGAHLLPPGEDPRLPALQAAADGGVVVSHRPGKRAVVRRGEEFVKVVRPGRSAGVLGGIARAGAFDGPFRTPAVRSHDGSTVVFEAVEGRSLHEAGAFDDGEWARAWREVLDAWVDATARPSARDRSRPAAGVAPDDARIHAGADEAAVLRDWLVKAEGLFGAERAAMAALVERTAARLEESPAPALVPAHRDLHDKQLIWDARRGPAILDVDTACHAPAALDLGNLRAHATWRARQGLWSTARDRAVAGRVDTAARAVGVSARDLDLYELSALLRLGCVYAFRPGWAHEARELRGWLVS